MRSLPVALVSVAALTVVLTGCSSAEEGFRDATTPATVTVTSPPPAQAGASTTPPVTQVVIPDVTEGQNGAIALDALERAGLTDVQPASRDDNDKFVVNPANWSVVSIEPSSGTEVSSDSTVVVTMTKE
ncbi:MULTISPECIES: PASTA domain-containing protein [unclassified Pseudonocardia]|uniref:PASTA domain-containing protein n=1 Tax=unclassified Pseudonocardia TaxID=2619320 RepID=UPI0001FFDDD7|nr:PASTA domain-containing protein [Pseudonocardia sp. Ae707_Ps1]OLM09096.1 hypothetical protein Ae707Ps1_6043c [Pseudonocardia sp. Ae707_Ps1]